jgi:acid phosphatase family membrane protein YuiD
VQKDKADKVIAGQSVGITFTDEFFNKRGEIITLAEDTPYVSTQFRANVFWMGKNPLVKGKSYKLKLTTQEVEAEVNSIVKIVDASSLDNNAGGEKVQLNEVAEIIIKTKEPVAFDEFKASHATGRFVIVDGYDVSGGGIIVKNEASQNINIQNTFVYKDIFARGDIFEEFYYSVDNLNISKKQINSASFTVGDTLPLQSDSYQYPLYFDILILRDNAAITVRDGKIAEITRINDYIYKGYPVVNGRGFEINVSTNKQVRDFIEQSETGTAEVLNEWLEFGKYRKISFK